MGFHVKRGAILAVFWPEKVCGVTGSEAEGREPKKNLMFDFPETAGLMLPGQYP